MALVTKATDGNDAATKVRLALLHPKLLQAITNDGYYPTDLEGWFRDNFDTEADTYGFELDRSVTAPRQEDYPALHALHQARMNNN